MYYIIIQHNINKVQDNKIRFSDYIGAVQQLKTKLSKLGARGTTTQQQTKQAIIASLIIQDNYKYKIY